jgi:integrase
VSTTRRARQHRGDGSIRQLPTGRFQVRVSFPAGPDGKRRQVSRYADSLKDARALRDTMRAEVKQPRRVDDASITVAELMRRWLATRELRPSTRKTTACNINKHIIPVLGAIPLSDLTPEDVDRLKLEALKTLAPRTVALIRRIFAEAVMWADNPRIAPGLGWIIRHSTPPKVERRQYQWLNAATAKQFLKAAEGSPYRTLYRLTLALALREGEALGLRWESVDLDHKRVTISHSLAHVDGTITLTELKTGASHATFAIDDTLAAALTELKARQTFDRTMAPEWLDSLGLAFTDQFGGYVPRSRLRTDFRRVLRLAGLKPMRFHDLRHSSISILRDAGADANTLQRFARHANVSTTLTTYVHLGQDAIDRATAALASAIS